MSNHIPKATTELEAVNIMLGAIGESPVNSLGGTEPANVDVAIARKVLAEVSKDVQSPGFHWNTDYDWPFAPTIDGTITVPANAIRVDADTDGTVDVVLRGVRLYDRKSRSYTFAKTVKAEVVWALPFEELPEAARRYITIRATRVFQDRVVGSDTLHAFNAQDEARARADFMNDEAEVADHNILNHGNAFDATRARPGFRRWR